MWNGAHIICAPILRSKVWICPITFFVHAPAERMNACKAVNLSVPLVVRMKGTNEDLGKKMLKESGLPIISADTMADAAMQIVAAVR